MSKKNYLTVPIQLDALYVHDDHYAVQNQMADFTLLPYATKGEGDINSSTAYIGESINQQAFGNNNLQLGQGVHLHWALPDGLTKGKQVNGELDFLAEKQTSKKLKIPFEKMESTIAKILDTCSEYV